MLNPAPVAPLPRLEDLLAGVSALVVDANISVDVVIGQPAQRALATRFFVACVRQNITLLAPALYGFEVDSVLRKQVTAKGMPPTDLLLARATLDSLPIQLLFDQAETIAARLNARQIADTLALSGTYDSLYAAIAQNRKIPFWTADRKFALAALNPRRQANGTMAPLLPFVQFISDCV